MGSASTREALPVRGVVALGVVAQDAQVDLQGVLPQYVRGLGSNLVIVTGL